MSFAEKVNLLPKNGHANYGLHGQSTVLGNRAAPLNNANQNNNDRQDKQNMDKASERVRGDQAQQPQNQKHYANRHQKIHRFSPCNPDVDEPSTGLDPERLA